ncbi:MAG TPA: nucleotidyltransferase domain-containing protein [Ilumatobacter sp.]
MLDRALQLLSEDDRVEAAVLTGSLGRGTEDRWSDIDLEAVIAPGADAPTVAAAWEVLAYLEWPIAHHYATEFGATLVRGYFLRNALLLDMAFTPADAFSVWAPVRVLFDRTGRTTEAAAGSTAWTPTTPDARGEAGFAGHDVLHACVAANRGRLWQSHYFLQRMRNRTLALASERHGWDSDDFTRVDDLPADEVRMVEESLVATLDRDALLGAVDVATRAFLDELGRHDRALADRLSEPLLELVNASRGRPR